MIYSEVPRGAFGERENILDLILLVTNASENEDGDNVRILINCPVATMLKVKPWLEERRPRG